MSDLADFFSEMDRSNEFSKWMDEIQRTSERIDELIYPQSVLEAIYPERKQMRLERVHAAQSLAHAIAEAPEDMVDTLIDAFSAIKAQARQSAGGRAKAANRAAADPYAWMRPIFAEAWARLEADCPKRIGHERLLVMARRIAGPGHPDHYRRDEMKERQARAYLKSIAEPSQRKNTGRVLSRRPVSVKSPAAFP